MLLDFDCPKKNSNQNLKIYKSHFLILNSEDISINFLMPSFVCESCETVLKKPKLPNHRCGTGFTCIDCLKTFREGTWIDHTKCKTEQEKVQGKLYRPKRTRNNSINDGKKNNSNNNDNNKNNNGNNSIVSNDEIGSIKKQKVNEISVTGSIENSINCPGNMNEDKNFEKTQKGSRDDNKENILKDGNDNKESTLKDGIDNKENILKGIDNKENILKDGIHSKENMERNKDKDKNKDKHKNKDKNKDKRKNKDIKIEKDGNDKDIRATNDIEIDDNKDNNNNNNIESIKCKNSKKSDKIENNIEINDNKKKDKKKEKRHHNDIEVSEYTKENKKKIKDKKGHKKDQGQ